MPPPSPCAEKQREEEHVTGQGGLRVVDQFECANRVDQPGVLGFCQWRQVNQQNPVQPPARGPDSSTEQQERQPAEVQALGAGALPGLGSDQHGPGRHQGRQPVGDGSQRGCSGALVEHADPPSSSGQKAREQDRRGHRCGGFQAAARQGDAAWRKWSERVDIVRRGLWWPSGTRV